MQQQHIVVRNWVQILKVFEGELGFVDAWAIINNQEHLVRIRFGVCRALKKLKVIEEIVFGVGLLYGKVYLVYLLEGFVQNENSQFLPRSSSHGANHCIGLRNPVVLWLEARLHVPKSHFVDLVEHSAVPLE